MKRCVSRLLGGFLEVLAVLLVLAASACRREERALPGPKPAASPSVIARAPSEPLPSASARVPPATEKAASDVVLAWNDALNRHDSDKLAGLYGETVRFYGRTLSREAVVSVKRAAFTEQPAFFQELIGLPEFRHTEFGTLAASFYKKSGEGGKWGVVAAKLVLSQGDAGTFVIVGETDEPSLRREDTIRERCKTAAATAVHALPEVKRAVADAQATADKSGGKARFGYLGPYDDGEGGLFMGGIGLTTDQRFDDHIKYRVQKGVLWVSVLGSPVTIPQDVLRKVKEACLQ